MTWLENTPFHYIRLSSPWRHVLNRTTLWFVWFGSCEMYFTISDNFCLQVHSPSHDHVASICSARSDEGRALQTVLPVSHSLPHCPVLDAHVARGKCSMWSVAMYIMVMCDGWIYVDSVIDVCSVSCLVSTLSLICMGPVAALGRMAGNSSSLLQDISQVQAGLIKAIESFVFF